MVEVAHPEQIAQGLEFGGDGLVGNCVAEQAAHLAALLAHEREPALGERRKRREEIESGDIAAAPYADFLRMAVKRVLRCLKAPAKIAGSLAVAVIAEVEQPMALASGKLGNRPKIGAVEAWPARKKYAVGTGIRRAPAPRIEAHGSGGIEYLEIGNRGRLPWQLR